MTQIVPIAARDQDMKKGLLVCFSQQRWSWLRYRGFPCGPTCLKAVVSSLETVLAALYDLPWSTCCQTRLDAGQMYCVCGDAKQRRSGVNPHVGAAQRAASWQRGTVKRKFTTWGDTFWQCPRPQCHPPGGGRTHVRRQRPNNVEEAAHKGGPPRYGCVQVYCVQPVDMMGDELWKRGINANCNLRNREVFSTKWREFKTWCGKCLVMCSRVAWPGANPGGTGTVVASPLAVDTERVSPCGTLSKRPEGAWIGP